MLTLQESLPAPGRLAHGLKGSWVRFYPGHIPWVQAQALVGVCAGGDQWMLCLLH